MAGYLDKIKRIIPKFMIQTIGQTLFIFDTIFKVINKLITNAGIYLQIMLKILLLIYFEKGLQNVNKNNFLGFL